MEKPFTVYSKSMRLLSLVALICFCIICGCEKDPSSANQQASFAQIDSIVPYTSTPGNNILIFGKNLLQAGEVTIVSIGNNTSKIVHGTNTVFTVHIPDSLEPGLYDVSLVVGSKKVDAPARLQIVEPTANYPEISTWSYSAGYPGFHFAIYIKHFAQYAGSAQVFFGSVLAPIDERKIYGDDVMLHMQIPLSATSAPFIIKFGANQTLVSDSVIRIYALPQLKSVDYDVCNQRAVFEMDSLANTWIHHSLLMYGDSLIAVSYKSSPTKITFFFEYQPYGDASQDLRWFGDKELSIEVVPITGKKTMRILTGMHPTPPVTENLRALVRIEHLPFVLEDSTTKDYTRQDDISSFDGGCVTAPNVYLPDSVAVTSDNTYRGSCTGCSGIHNEILSVTGTINKNLSLFSSLTIVIDSGDVFTDSWGTTTSGRYFYLTLQAIPFVTNADGSIQVHIEGAALANAISLIHWRMGNISNTKSGFKKSGEFLAHLGSDWNNASLDINIRME